MKKVMVFGTFDGLHRGHLNLFQQAKKFGDELVIVVARNINVEKIKGCLPKFDEKKRLEIVKKEIKRWKDEEIGNKIILGGLNDPYAVIKKEKPDVICLGYDQNSFTKNLKRKFDSIKIIRLKSYKPEIYKSSKLNRSDNL